MARGQLSQGGHHDDQEGGHQCHIGQFGMFPVSIEKDMKTSKQGPVFSILFLSNLSGDKKVMLTVDREKSAFQR